VTRDAPVRAIPAGTLDCLIGRFRKVLRLACGDRVARAILREQLPELELFAPVRPSLQHVA
jgi:hypothetical protein